MDDYLSEKEQWERLKQWLASNGAWIAAGVVVGVLGLFGWRQWQERQDRIALEAGGKYEQLLQSLGRADRTRAEGIAEELRKDYASSPFVDQADLTLARAYVESGDLAKAAERLKGVAERSRDDELKLIARLRLARVQIAQGKPDDALATLGAAQPGAFAPRFESVRGDAYLAKGDRKTALEAYRKARAADAAAGAGTGVVDSEVLDLKIGDLSPAGSAAAAPAPAGSPATAAASR